MTSPSCLSRGLTSLMRSLANCLAAKSVCLFKRGGGASPYLGGSPFQGRKWDQCFTLADVQAGRLLSNCTDHMNLHKGFWRRSPLEPQQSQWNGSPQNGSDAWIGQRMGYGKEGVRRHQAPSIRHCKP